jgi:hypothetical protein
MTLLDRINEASAAARHWLQYTSMQMGVAFSAFLAWIAAYPDQWQQLVSHLPEQVRPVVIAAVSLAAIIWARTRHQPGIKPKGGTDGQ